MATSIYMTKICNKCKIEKQLDCFHKSKSHSTGYASICKECKKSSNKLYYQSNKEKVCERTNQYYYKHKEERQNYPSRQTDQVLKYNQMYYKENKNYLQQQNRLYVKTKWENKLWYNAWYASQYRKYVKVATPKWADIENIKSVYKQCSTLTTESGIPHEVDHIVPLQGKNVCGLHYEHNLRIVTQTENRTKQNKLIESIL